jgi:hypothetical protein
MTKTWRPLRFSAKAVNGVGPRFDAGSVSPLIVSARPDNVRACMTLKGLLALAVACVFQVG